MIDEREEQRLRAAQVDQLRRRLYSTRATVLRLPSGEHRPRDLAAGLDQFNRNDLAAISHALDRAERVEAS